MGYHHLALATRDLPATHRFYTDVMGFRLVKVETAPTEAPGGWAKHVFYDTGDGTMFAVWELHDDTIGQSFPTDLSKSHGLPVWVNHVAFSAADGEDLDRRLRHWRECGITVAEIDHGWCRSIYATDPNGILVEFCTTTRAFTDADTAEAERLLADPAPPLETPPVPRIHAPVVPAG